jgi:hypothetical protein
MLVPAGFVPAKAATYVRRQEDQIHLIHFQGSKWGGSYTVNLGFHYSFLTPRYARKRIALAGYHLLDCAFQSRIGSFVDGRDIWFEYGNDPIQFQERIEQNVATASKSCRAIESGGLIRANG